jgi:hypothetical protein
MIFLMIFVRVLLLFHYSPLYFTYICTCICSCVRVCVCGGVQFKKEADVSAEAVALRKGGQKKKKYKSVRERWEHLKKKRKNAATDASSTG